MRRLRPLDGCAEQGAPACHAETEPARRAPARGRDAEWGHVAPIRAVVVDKAAARDAGAAIRGAAALASGAPAGAANETGRHENKRLWYKE